VAHIGRRPGNFAFLDAFTCFVHGQQQDEVAGAPGDAVKAAAPVHVARNEWVKYTVEVVEAGTYSVGGVMAVVAGANGALDFGNGIATATFPLPVALASRNGAGMYHSWKLVSNLAKVTLPAGTYLKGLTFETFRFNSVPFVFTKMFATQAMSHG
jgi:hypothetical protein